MAYPPPTAPASLSGMPPTADCYCSMPGWLAMALRLSDSLVEAGGQRKWGKSLQVDTPSRNMFYYCSSRLRPLASGSHSSAAGEARERRRKKRIPAQLLPNLVLRTWARSFAQSSTCPPPPHPFRSLPDPDNPISVSLVQPIPNKHGAAVLFSGSFHPPVPLLWNLHALFDVEGRDREGKQGGIAHVRCRPYHNSNRFCMLWRPIHCFPGTHFRLGRRDDRGKGFGDPSKGQKKSRTQ